jgi:GntR family transcriptional regulator
VSKAAAAGQVRSGEQMPSVRALAEELVINPNTVARAYQDLVREGVLETQRGKGIYVADHRQVISKDEQDRRLDAAIDVFLHEVVLLGTGHDAIVDRLRIRLRELGVPAEGRKDGAR